MSALFSAPKMPAVTPTPPVPTAASATVQQASADERAALASAGGRASTILTSGMGAMGPPTTRKIFLGAG
jgi:hypothetical protein